MSGEEIAYLGTTDVWKALMAVYKRHREARKWRFFGVACCRRVWHLLPPASRPLVEVVERLLAGTARDGERASLYANAPDLLYANYIEKAAWHTASPGNLMRGVGSREIPYNALQATVTADGGAARDAASADLANAVRDIFGNPFRPVPVLDPAWLTGNDGTVRKLAQGIHDDRLPILADALEDAGCTATELLAHLRGPGPHVPGCWAVDLLIGKK